MKRTTFAKFAKLALVSHTAVYNAVTTRKLTAITDGITGMRLIVIDGKARTYLAKHKANNARVSEKVN